MPVLNSYLSKIHVKQSILEELLGAVEYFEDRKDKGSGTVESACKNVIGSRLKGSGMTRSPAGPAGMLHIRCSLESGHFYDDFRNSLKKAA